MDYTRLKIYRNITTSSPHTTLYTSVCVRAMLSAKKGQQKVNFERIRECFVGLSMLISLSAYCSQRPRMPPLMIFKGSEP